MSTTDIHRLIDNKLPEGKTCSAVIMAAPAEGGTETYTATIDGQDIAAEADPQTSPEAIADCIVAQIATAKNARVEGDDAEPEPEPEPEAKPDDDEDDVSEFDAPKSKSKSKSKK